MDENAKVPKNSDTNGDLKGNNSRCLGLQDLYKAAFSQENNTEYEPVLKNCLQTSEIYESNELKDVKSEENENYQLYTFKNLPVCSVDLDKNNDDGFKLSPVTYNQNSEYSIQEISVSQHQLGYNDKTSIILHGSFLTNETVLDLDKGIPVHVVKVSDENTCSSTTELSNFNRNYQGDTQILQRYLNDTVVHRSEDADDNIDYFLIRKNVNDQTNVGVAPEQIGVKYEDCDFNSSDSFASTESIIPKNIQCPKCPKKFMFKSDLIKHDKHKHTFKQKLNCKYCTKEFVSQQNLLFHEKSHQKRSNIKCEDCNKLFKKPGFLIKHMIKKHSKSSGNSCSVCNKVFGSEILVALHYKKYHKCYKCDTCDKLFEKKQNLELHEKSHSEGSQHVCDYCGKSFYKICYLKNHLKSHNVNNDSYKEFICKICSKVLKNENALAEHLRRHTGEKPYNCLVCNKSFAYQSYFKIHQKKHEDVKYSCSYCDKTFPTHTDLSKHISSHTHDRTFTCTNCNQSFTQQSHLLTHWKKQMCNIKAGLQEESTQTNGFDLQEIGDKILATNCVNVSYNTNTTHNFNTQPILLTTIGEFSSSNSLPMIVSTESVSDPQTFQSLSS